MAERTQHALPRAAAARWLQARLNLPQAPHPATLAKWERGEGTRRGVRLKATVLGGRSWYSRADLEAFVQELNNAEAVQ